MNISDAGKRSGLPPKTIRFYEEIGLITPTRQANGYRDFSEEDLHKLAFLRRARALGFTTEECRQLMGLYTDKKPRQRGCKIAGDGAFGADRRAIGRIAGNAPDIGTSGIGLRGRRAARLPNPVRPCARMTA